MPDPRLVALCRTGAAGVAQAQELSRALGGPLDLTAADFRAADLRGADFSGALLSAADFRAANIRGAVFRGADLTGADLRNCRYSASALVDLAQWEIDWCGARGVLDE